MNYPNQKTCKAIESEFEYTEFAWYEGSISHSNLVPLDLDCERTYAPTCDELIARIKLWIDLGQDKEDVFDVMFKAFTSDNPAQSLAESLIKIIEDEV